MTASLWSLRLAKVAVLVRRPGEFRRALRFRTAPSVEFLPALRAIAPAVVIDAGANVGQFAWAVAIAAPQARLHLFEPIPGCLEVAGAVLSSLGVDHKVHCVALGAEDGEGVFFVENHSDQSSLLRPVSTRWKRQMTVPVRTLDSVDLDGVLSRPGPKLLKIDVQGSELAILNGASRTLPLIDHVLVELSLRETYVDQPLADEVVASLTNHGFVLSDLLSVLRSRSGQAIQFDALFSRPEDRS